VDTGEKKNPMTEPNQKKLMETTLDAFGIQDVDNTESAFSIVIDSLAMISKDTAIHNLRDLITTINFSFFPLLMSFDQAQFSEIENLVKNRVATIASNDIYRNQIHVQRLLNPSKRKKLAAYYTNPIGLDVMQQVLSRHSTLSDAPLTLSDPFLGSGLTLSEVVRRTPHLQIHKIWGVEPHPLSALVAYSAILHVVHGDMEKVQVIIGDSFKLVNADLPSTSRFEKESNKLPKADIILTNPPFTRWELLDKQTRSFLDNLVNRLPHRKYVGRKQLNLQVFALFLMDYFLKNKGLLISVLPASTFYTIYGEAAKDMFTDKYQLQAIFECKHGPSFSIDSGFKELIIVASKRQASKETVFITLDDQGALLQKIPTILEGERISDRNINWVDIHNVPSPWKNNWLTLFSQNEVRDQLSNIFEKAFQKETIGLWANSPQRRKLVRGVEMYGPDFFFIPNKHWKLVEDDLDSIRIWNSNMEQQLQISTDFLVKALRKPALYTNTLSPVVKHYFLSIPSRDLSDLPSDVVSYIQWGVDSKAALPAIRAFGRFWYSHVYRQLQVKRPFGRLFLPDKIDPSFKKRGVFCCYSRNPLTASKNFYIGTFGDELLDKATAAWFNSTIFIAFFIVASRKISERWTRFLKEDYLTMPILKAESLRQKELETLSTYFDKTAENTLPPIPFQLRSNFRKELDTVIFSVLGLDTTLSNDLYGALEKAFNEMEAYH
jgi:hypothetical protein